MTMPARISLHDRTMHQFADFIWKIHVRRSVNIDYDGFRLTVPANHLIRSIRKKQPRREEGLRISARHVFNKYPSATYVDIGANIGDTAAIVRLESTCNMVLIEPSDIYFSYLERNLTVLRNSTAIHGFLVPENARLLNLSLEHINSTARLQLDPIPLTTARSVRNLTLSDVYTSNTGDLIKLDTDGYDVELIREYASDFSQQNANLYFELEIRSWDDVEVWTEVLSLLFRMGYTNFLFWDDPGHYMGQATEISHAVDLLRWQYSYKNSRHFGEVRIHNFDVLATSALDADIGRDIVAHYSRRTSWDVAYKQVKI